MIVGVSLAILTSAAAAYWNTVLLPERRKQTDIEETLKNNPSAYVAPDGEIKYRKQVIDINDNTSDQHEQSSVLKDDVKSKSPLENIQKNRDMPNPQIMAKLEEDLTKELVNKGFPANEAELIFKEIKAGIESGETNSLSTSKEKLTKDLGLSHERRSAMDSAIELAMDDTGGAHRLEEWETCFNRRIENFKANECEENLIADFKEIVRANSENNRINSVVRNKMSAIEMDFAIKSKQKCKSDILAAAKLFSVLVSNCN
jgi:hypothetical protein